MKRILVAAFIVAAFGVTVWADGKNLQFFPKDTSSADLKAEMNTIKRSLGTDCKHCHQMDPRDMSVDTPTKKIARDMLVMQKKLNEKCFTKDFLGGRRAPPPATCYLCHKGNEKPELEAKNPDDEKQFNDDVAAGKHKRTVDAMKKLVAELNQNYFTWKDAPKATCWMCHRGSSRVRGKLPPAPADASKPDAPKPDSATPDAPKPANPDAPKTDDPAPGPAPAPAPAPAPKPQGGDNNKEPD